MATHIERVLWFGGSNMQGADTTPLQPSHVDLLRDHYVRELNGAHSLVAASLSGGGLVPLFYDLSVWSDRAKRLAEHIRNEVAHRGQFPRLERSKNLFIVSIGGTDALPTRDVGEPLTPPDVFTEAVESIAASLVSEGKMLYIGLTAVNEELASEHLDWQVAGWNRYRAAFECEAANAFRKLGGYTIELCARSMNDSEWEVCDDGIHPSASKGEPWLYAEIRPTFDTIVCNE